MYKRGVIMRKIILAVIATASIICLTGCESPEERDHRLDVEEVGILHKR